MDGEIGGGDGCFGGCFPPVGELLVVDHRFGVEKVETIVNEPDSERIMVLFSPCVDVVGVFVHVVFLDEQSCDDNHQEGGQ